MYRTSFLSYAENHHQPGADRYVSFKCLEQTVLGLFVSRRGSISSIFAAKFFCCFIGRNIINRCLNQWHETERSDKSQRICVFIFLSTVIGKLNEPLWRFFSCKIMTFYRNQEALTRLSGSVHITNCLIFFLLFLYLLIFTNLRQKNMVWNECLSSSMLCQQNLQTYSHLCVEDLFYFTACYHFQGCVSYERWDWATSAPGKMICCVFLSNLGTGNRIYLWEN